MTYFHFRGLLQTSGWLAPAYVGIDAQGVIRYLSDEPPENPVSVEFVNGFALPGFPNAHSHAFQYAMAGMAERHKPGTRDDFWSWREAMYACALSMDPDQMQAVAAMLYAELLRKGYTHVAEFHYIHHDKNGHPYANLAEMGARLIEAAKEAGIRITLIPVFYQQGGFGKDPEPRQRRFISKTVDDYFRLLDHSAKMITSYGDASLGFSVHSLRAVTSEDIITTIRQGPKGKPFHIHAAEQLREVEDCLAHLKQRPVQWILNNLHVNENFHLVHCTHLDDEEVRRLAESGAHAVLCPGTEGNLGDGIFRLSDFAAAKGKWSVGTDSHISLNPLEDMRWLDYAQRLTTHKRNTFSDGASMLLDRTIRSGRKAMGISAGDFFSVGEPLDAVVYDRRSPLLSAERVEHLLSTIVYTSDSGDVLGTLVNGSWIVKENRHIRDRTIRENFAKALARLKY